eukprot:snap_masked-scaffold119_size336447-processed-gene-0.2 protein:Tk11769 transcript:snap_masked-scaffold119_size336447-processed-gene-0.2-mRNA-1 annotation:"---NA---"
MIDELTAIVRLGGGRGGGSLIAAGRSGSRGVGVGGSSGLLLLLLGEADLSGHSLGLLGEGDLGGNGQDGRLGPVAILIGNPGHGHILTVSIDVSVAAAHHHHLDVVDGLHLAGGLLLDAIFGLEGEVVVLRLGRRGVVHGADDGDGLGGLSGSPTGGLVARITGNTATGDGSHSQGEDGEELEGDTREKDEGVGLSWGGGSLITVVGAGWCGSSLIAAGGGGSRGVGVGGGSGLLLLLLGEADLSGHSLGLLGEGDLGGNGQDGRLGPVAILIGHPGHGHILAIGIDVSVAAAHHHHLDVVDGLHLAGGLLLDAILGLEGEVVVLRLGRRGVVHGADDGDGLGGLSGTPTGGLVAGITGNAPAGDGGQSQGEDGEELEGDTKEKEIKGGLLLLLLGEADLSGHSLGLLGEGDLGGNGQDGRLGPVAILIGHPGHGHILAIGIDVSVAAAHHHHLDVVDGLHLAGGLLLDAILGLEGEVVVLRLGRRGVVHGADDGDGLGGLSGTPTGGLVAGITGNAPAGDGGQSQGEDCKELEGGTRERYEGFLAVLALAVASVSGGRIVRDSGYQPAGGRAAQPAQPIAIVRSVYNAPSAESQNYDFSFETENGIQQEASGEMKTVDNVEVMVMRGSYTYIDADGQDVTVSWVADENGYRAESAILPIAPEIPFPEQAEAVAAQIRFAQQEEQQVAASSNSYSSAPAPAGRYESAPAPAPAQPYYVIPQRKQTMVKRDTLRTNLDKLRKSHNDPKVLWGLANAVLGKPLNASLPTSLLVNGIASAQWLKGGGGACPWFEVLDESCDRPLILDFLYDEMAAMDKSGALESFESVRWTLAADSQAIATL